MMIVVTGASGFIGANMVEAISRRGSSSVVAVDEYPEIHGRGLGRPTGQTRYLQHVPVEGCLDFRDLPEWLERQGDAVNAIVHLGACSDTTVTDRAFVMARNYEYTKRLWQWCTATDRPLVYASSAATYGDGSAGFDDRADPHAYQPLNLYGESKHRFDLWALSQDQAPPRWAGVKYFNVYGPHEWHKHRMASMFFHSFHQIVKTGQVRLFQSHRDGIPHGGQLRDFIYVADAVEATLHLLDTPVTDTAPNGLYNVGTGQARSFCDLAQAVFAALQREPNIQYVPMPDDLRGKYQYFTQATTEKLGQAGFSTKFHSIEQGALDYVKEDLLRCLDGEKSVA